MDGDFQSLVDCLEDGIIIVDRECRVIQCNAAIRNRLIGPSVACCTGQSCRELLPCQPTEHGQQEWRCLALQVLAVGCAVRETRHCRMGSQSHWYDVLASPIHAESGEITRVVEVWRDITEIKTLEAHFQQRLKELSDLHLTALASTSTLSLRQVLDSTLALTLDILHADAGGVYLLQESSGEKVLRLRAYRSLDWEVARDIDYLRLGEGFSGRVVQSGTPMIIADVRTDPRLTRQLLNQENLHSLLVVPLKSDKGILGTIWLGTRSLDNPFGENERNWLVAAGSQLALAVENARLYEEVHKREEERSRLLEHIIHAQEEERKRVARELHDETNQALTALGLKVESLCDELPLPQNNLSLELTRLKLRIDQAADDLQQIILDLRPGPLDDLGLLPAIKWYASVKLEALGIDLVFDLPEDGPALSDEQEITLFRVVQEAVNNIVQHAEASQVTISMHVVNSALITQIQDNGRGFTVETQPEPTSGHLGLGLLGMRERLVLISGTLGMQSSPGRGTILRVMIPFDQPKS